MFHVLIAYNHDSWPRIITYCLVIALKCRERMEISPAFAAEKICAEMYHPEEFVNMEIEILRTLSWRLNGPTPQEFIRQLVRLLPPSTDDEVLEKLVKEADQRAETAMTDYDTVMEPYSIIALTALLLSIRRNAESIESLRSIDVDAWMSTVSNI
jgi:hypothetical protein